jgi:predicted nucleic acid-binding protein
MALAARHVVVDTHVVRYFCCIGWEEHLEVAFDSRLHVADAVCQELHDQKRKVKKIKRFLDLPRSWSLERAQDAAELQQISDLQRDWEAKNGRQYDAFFNLGEAESIVVCYRRDNRAASWTFITNDRDAKDSARLLEVPVINPFFVVALFVHQGYIDKMAAWGGYQSMVKTHGMIGYLGLDAEPAGQMDFLGRLSTALTNP